MGQLFSTFEEMKSERLLNKLMTEIITGKLDETPLPRPDELLSDLPLSINRLNSIYQLTGKQYMVSISAIVCEEISSKDSTSSRNPFIILQFGVHKGETINFSGFQEDPSNPDTYSFQVSNRNLLNSPTSTENTPAAASHCIYSFPTNEVVIATSKLNIQIFGYTLMRQKVLIAEGEIEFSPLIPRLGKETDLSVILLDNKGNKFGKLTIYAKLEIAVEICISKIICKELKNVEFFGKNDPFVELQFDNWNFKTKYQDNAGSEATWDNLILSFQTSQRLLHDDSLIIRVFDYNDLIQHRFIGEGSLSISSLAEKSGQESEFTVNIVDKKGWKSGAVIINLRMEKMPEGDRLLYSNVIQPPYELDDSRRLEAFQILQKLKTLSDWGGNWRLMAQPNTQLISTLVGVVQREYSVDSKLDSTEYAQRYSASNKKIAPETAVFCTQIFKNLSMSNITGTYVSNFESGVMQVLIALNYASGYTKRKSKKNETLLEDITSICWYLLDTHLERRDNSDLDRFLHVWKETSGEHRKFEEKCSLREYICCLIFSFKVYSCRNWVQKDFDIRREFEVASLKYLLNMCDDVNSTFARKLGTLRILLELCKNPFNRKVLLLLDVFRMVLIYLEKSCLDLNRDFSRVSIEPFPVEYIRQDLYKAKGLSTDDKELLKLNVMINKDSNSLMVKYCTLFLTQMMRFDGFISLASLPKIQPLLIRAAGLLMLGSSLQSSLSDYLVVGLTAIASFAGNQYHGKVANLISSPAGRTGTTELIFTLFFAMKYRLGENLIKEISTSINPDIIKEVNYKPYMISIHRITCSSLNLSNSLKDVLLRRSAPTSSSSKENTLSPSISPSMKNSLTKQSKFFGKLNIFVEFQFESYKEKTTTQSGLGSDCCEWTDVNKCLPCQENNIKTNKLKVKVYDYSDSQKHNLIGEASVDVSFLLATLEQETSKVFDIFNHKKEKTGSLRITLSLDPMVLLSINRIVCKNLSNVEIFGHNDPFVALQYGSSWKDKTEAQDDAGANAEWNNLGFKIATTIKLLANEKLFVQVLDHNDVRSHTSIGECSFDLKSLILQIETHDNMSKPTNLISDIKNIKSEKSEKSGEISLFLKAEMAPDAHKIIIDYSLDPIYQLEQFIQAKDDNFMRLMELSKVFNASLGFKTVLELSKNDIMKSSILGGQPLALFRMIFEAFYFISTRDSEMPLDSKYCAYDTYSDGLEFELSEITSYCVDILLHLMCFIDLQCEDPITATTVQRELDFMLEKSKEIYRTARDKADSEKEKKIAREAFDKRNLKYSTDAQKLKEIVSRNDLWWSFASKEKSCNDLIEIIDKLIVQQNEISKRRKSKFILPPETTRHMYYLLQVLRKHSSASLQLTKSLSDRQRIKVAICFCHSLDVEENYLNYYSLKKLTKSRNNSTRNSISTRSSINFDKDELELSGDEGNHNSTLSGEENMNLGEGELSVPSYSPSSMQIESDKRVNALIKSLLKSGVEVIIDKTQPALEVTEMVLLTGVDETFPTIKADLLIEETLSSCSALIICVNSKCYSHPGIRFVTKSALSIRNSKKTPTANDNSDVESNISISHLKVFFVLADTGLDDNEHSKNLSSMSQFSYGGWVDDILKPPKQRGHIVGRMHAKEYNNKFTNIHSIPFVEDSLEKEIILPLWASEHIEATSIFIQHAVYSTNS